MTVSVTHPRSVIWDFNGTILDDVDLAARSITELRARRGLAPVSADDHRRVFRFPVADYYRDLGFDFDNEDHADVSEEYHDVYLAGIPACSMNDGVVDLLDRFRSDGIPQAVLSAAQQDLLDGWVDALGIRSYFRAVYGLPDKLAASKLARGRALIEHLAFDPADTLFIGDTDHDIDVARSLDCRPVVVLQGHQDRSRFTGAPGLVLPTFSDLTAALP